MRAENDMSMGGMTNGGTDSGRQDKRTRRPAVFTSALPMDPPESDSNDELDDIEGNDHDDPQEEEMESDADSEGKLVFLCPTQRNWCFLGFASPSATGVLCQTLM